jgi:hypothetical protein
VAKALNGFRDGTEKSAVAAALFGVEGAKILPFLKDLSAEGGRQFILTDEQIKQAQAFTSAQAAQREQITLYAQAIASKAIPTISAFTELLRDVARDQEFAATASDVLKGALSAAVTIFQTLAIVGSDVGFVFKGVGREIGAIAAQIAALGRGDLKGFSAISEAVKEDGVRARAELDKFQARIAAIGKPSTAVATATAAAPDTGPSSSSTAPSRSRAAVRIERRSRSCWPKQQQTKSRFRTCLTAGRMPLRSPSSSCRAHIGPASSR